MRAQKEDSQGGTEFESVGRWWIVSKCAILNRRQACAFDMLHPSLGSKGFQPVQSLQKGNGGDTL
jgi:hypothetical protein